MRRMSRFVLVGLTFVLLPLCMGASCSRDAREAAYGAVLDYVSGTTGSAMQSAFPLSDAFANLFAGPTGEQDQ